MQILEWAGGRLGKNFGRYHSLLNLRPKLQGWHPPSLRTDGWDYLSMPSWNKRGRFHENRPVRRIYSHRKLWDFSWKIGLPEKKKTTVIAWNAYSTRYYSRLPGQSHGGWRQATSTAQTKCSGNMLPSKSAPSFTFCYAGHTHHGIYMAVLGRFKQRFIKTHSRFLCAPGDLVRDDYDKYKNKNNGRAKDIPQDNGQITWTKQLLNT